MGASRGSPSRKGDVQNPGGSSPRGGRAGEVTGWGEHGEGEGPRHGTQALQGEANGTSHCLESQRAENYGASEPGCRRFSKGMGQEADETWDGEGRWPW